MRLSRQKVDTVTSPAHETPHSLVASAARINFNLNGQGWRNYKFGDDAWQQEAWRLYDIIGELRFIANWIGSACSRVRIYVAEVDDYGRVQQETKNKKVAGLADTLFGGPSSKSEALRMLGINLTVAGDAYIIGRSTKDPESDEWYVVSCSELKRYGSNFWWLIDPEGKLKDDLDPTKDIIIRVWTPHPRRNLWADSPTRAAMPMLYEIEKLTKFVFAQMDSRLVSAGMIPIPANVSFPDQDPELSGAEALTEVLTRTGSKALQGEGTAAGVVPTFVEMPESVLGKIELIQFTSELSKNAIDLRKEAIGRLGLAMDIDPMILAGAGDANHWGAWQIVEGQIKIHIEPLMTRICDALTTAYLIPALKSMDQKTEKYVFWYDTAPLTVRPQRLKDTLELWDKGPIVSRDAVRRAGDYKETDAPSEEEDLERFTRELMLRDPNLFQIPAVRKIAGYTDEILPPQTVVTPQQGPGAPGAGPPPPPAPPTGIEPATPAPLPATTEAQNAPGGPPATPSGVTAAAMVPSPVTTFVISNAAVLRALEMAGKRLVGKNGQRSHYPDTPAHELHTRVSTGSSESAEKLLAGAWDHLSVLAEHLDPGIDQQRLQNTLHDYCMTLLIRERPHQVNLLGEKLRAQGFLDGYP